MYFGRESYINWNQKFPVTLITKSVVFTTLLRFRAMTRHGRFERFLDAPRRGQSSSLF